MSEIPLPPTPIAWPMAPSLEIQAAVQAARDDDHLRLLEIGYIISGALTTLKVFFMVLFGLMLMITGLVATFSSNKNDPAAPIVFLAMGGLVGAVLFFTIVFAALEIYAGFCLKNHRHLVVIQIVAALNCLSLPWGTALGVGTFMVLGRPSVRALFAPR